MPRDIFVHAPNDIVGHRLFNFHDLHVNPFCIGALRSLIQVWITDSPLAWPQHFRDLHPQIPSLLSLPRRRLLLTNAR